MMHNHSERKNIRLKSWDYSSDGAYFVTICTKDRENFFGEIVDGEMMLNEIGLMVEKWWKKIEEKYETVTLDNFIIMPNHIHGIIIIYNVGADPCVGPDEKIFIKQNRQKHGAVPTVSSMVQWFKTMAANEYLKKVKNNQWPVFDGKIWQRSFHDRIIRNKDEFLAFQKYILENPRRWEEDQDNL